MSAPTKTFARWSIELLADCPHCQDYVDLLEDSDFWHSHPKLKPGETRTDASVNIEVLCPSCGAEFKCDLEY